MSSLHSFPDLALEVSAGDKVGAGYIDKLRVVSDSQLMQGIHHARCDMLAVPIVDRVHAQLIHATGKAVHAPKAMLGCSDYTVRPI
jgi:hypothetical protein